MPDIPQANQAFSVPDESKSLAGTPGPSVAHEKALELQHAFDLFNQVSAELTTAYQSLQGRVDSLTAELAVANGELRKQYLEKQALSERLTSLVSSLPAGVLVIGADGVVGEANPAAIGMFGEAIVGAHWQTAGRLQPSGAPDEWAIDTSPEVRVHAVTSPLPITGGKIVLVHDITAAHEMKTTLERNRRLAAMGEMAASLAHQLRTPLSTALLYSANLAKPDLTDEARTRFADRATEQLKRLERLIQNVLLFARGESIGREAIAVGPWVDEIVALMLPLFREREVVLESTSTVGDTVVVGDRKALLGAAVNLLENALQVSDSGSIVRLGAAIHEGSFRLSVRDHGPGISPPLRERIFEPFYTTRGQGTGLGLAIALGVARAHGGNIEVSSDTLHGGGAEFVFSLPAGDPGDLMQKDAI